MTCDFCLGPDPVWDYPTTGDIVPVRHGPFTVIDTGDGYASCEQCAELVEVMAWDLLTARIVDAQQEHVPAGSVRDGGVVVYPDRDTMMQHAAQGVTMFVMARSAAGFPERLPLETGGNDG